MFPLRGTWPLYLTRTSLYAAGWAGNSRGDKFGVLERGVEQDLITRGTGAAPFVAGNLPADRQVRSSRPRKGNTPPPGPPAPLPPVTTTFVAPEASVFLIEDTG